MYSKFLPFDVALASTDNVPSNGIRIQYWIRQQLRTDWVSGKDLVLLRLRRFADLYPFVLAEVPSGRRSSSQSMPPGIERALPAQWLLWELALWLRC